MRAGPPSATKEVVQELRAELAGHAGPLRVGVMKRFFKTGKGQYGQGDVFIGVAVPASRRVARKCAPRMSLADVQALLQSKVHEERLVALLVLVDKFAAEPDAVMALFLDSLERVNSWDLVDLSAPRILGALPSEARATGPSFTGWPGLKNCGSGASP